MAKGNKQPEKLSAGIELTALRAAIILAGIFSGLCIGLYADKITGFDPSFTLLFIIAGIIASSWGSTKLNKKEGV
jgi:F0F1-type ATP synthase assembly protein I